jgi:hypothetical protein
MTPQEVFRRFAAAARQIFSPLSPASFQPPPPPPSRFSFTPAASTPPFTPCRSPTPPPYALHFSPPLSVYFRRYIHITPRPLIAFSRHAAARQLLSRPLREPSDGVRFSFHFIASPSFRFFAESAATLAATPPQACHISTPRRLRFH